MPARAQQGWLVVRSDEEPPSLAVLLDDARELIVASRDEGVEPAGLLVDPATHTLLERTKRHQTSHGAPLAVLGFAVAPLADQGGAAD